MPHYDTTKSSPDELKQYAKQTATQDDRIANFFEADPDAIWTPWEIQSLVFTPPMPPITSVRRSISDLTKAHILTKTEHKKEVGGYGRRSYAWVLNEKYRETVDTIEDMDRFYKFAAETEEEALIDWTKTSPGEGLPLVGGWESGDEIITSPQGKLFDVPPIKEPPVHCAICNRELTNPYSIKLGVGPICHGKCMADVLKKEKYGL